MVTRAEGERRVLEWARVAAAGGAALLLYVTMMARVVTGEDAGEFITAAWTLGVPHPPGYPLYCLLAAGFSRLPGLGPVAGVALLSAVCAAMTVALLALLARMLCRDVVAGMLAALLFAVTPSFWKHALIPEVYAPTALLTVMLWLVLAGFDASGDRKWLWWIAVVTGLGLAMHNTFILLAFPTALFVLSRDRSSRARGTGEIPWRSYAVCVLVALGCWAVWQVYIPLRSLANPPLDWGNSETLSAWWRHVRREQYDFMVSAQPRIWPRLVAQARMMLGLYLEQGLFPLDLVGFVLLWRLCRRWALYLAGCAVLVVAGFTFWQNPEPTREWRLVMSVFPIPAYMAGALCVALSLNWLRRMADMFRGGKRFVTVLAIGYILVLLVARFPDQDRRDFSWAREYGLNLLRSLPRNAVYVSNSDHGSFSVLYLQAVEGVRRDVANARVYGYLTPPDVDRLPASWRDMIGPQLSRSREWPVLEQLVLASDRPWFFEQYPVFSLDSGIRVIPWGLLWRALKPADPVPEENPWALYRWPDFRDRRGDFTADLIACDLLFARAAEELWRTRPDTTPDPDAALAWRKRAVSLVDAGLDIYGPDDGAMLNNAGVLCARFGAFQEALRYFERAQRQLPWSKTIHDNLARCRARVSQVHDARVVR
ncbi:MAG TPA: DUF2723 domain-containing protein [Candidatus Hydrogenedentes bacterium]|nr:DUF2723 domain-containing protein [Candidatus Hydrogenedentota bacterium]HOK90374.1 DUF2723 domain-containing protein [Candidatus Hydrogenedentota bacterium]HPO30073.1 DUF2723 domain-containing protein [Candidatus Hydrogenedentota bacterium]